MMFFKNKNKETLQLLRSNMKT